MFLSTSPGVGADAATGAGAASVSLAAPAAAAAAGGAAPAAPAAPVDSPDLGVVALAATPVAGVHSGERMHLVLRASPMLLDYAEEILQLDAQGPLGNQAAFPGMLHRPIWSFPLLHATWYRTLSTGRLLTRHLVAAGRICRTRLEPGVRLLPGCIGLLSKHTVGLGHGCSPAQAHSPPPALSFTRSSDAGPVNWLCSSTCGMELMP